MHEVIIMHDFCTSLMCAGIYRSNIYNFIIVKIKPPFYWPLHKILVMWTLKNSSYIHTYVDGACTYLYLDRYRRNLSPHHRKSACTYLYL